MIGHNFEQRKEMQRMLFDRVVDPGRSEQLRPKALANLERFDGSARLLFSGLEQHYMECVMSGRLDVWGATAHAIVELLVSDQIPFARRAELPDYEPC